MWRRRWAALADVFTPRVVLLLAGAVAVAGGAQLPPSLRLAAAVGGAGMMAVAPRPARLVAVVVVVAAAWGAARADQLAQHATPLAAQKLRGAEVWFADALPRAAPGAAPASARARWEGHTIVVSGSRFGAPVPRIARGMRARVDGALAPLGVTPGDRRLARAGASGRLIVTRIVGTPRAGGGPRGAIDGVARTATTVFDRAGGPRAGPLLAGVSLGLADEIAPADRDTLQSSGLWHLAAASGGNIALVVALCFVGGWCLGLGDRARILLSAAAVIAYIPLAGGGPSIQRAGVMGIVMLAGLWNGREHQVREAWALAAFVTLAITPVAWLDLGWQLSFAASAGLILAAGPTARALTTAGLPRPLAAAGATTLIATVATAPLTIAAFSTVSAAGLLTNVAALPLAAIAVWSGACAAVVAPISPDVAVVVATPGSWASHGLLEVAAWGAGRAHAGLSGQTALIVVVLVCAAWVARVPRAVVSACVVVALAWVAFAVPRPPAEPRLVVLDIGQGSAALLQAGDEAVLVDAGPADGGVVGQLRRAGVRRLRAVVLSHPAADHDGGGAAVLAAFPTDLLLDGGDPGGGPTHAAAIREARRRGVRVVPVRAGQRLRLGRIDLWIRWPSPAAAHAPGDPNDRAAVVQATLGDLRVIVPADAESNVLNRLPGLVGDVLVISHHGSADPGLPALLHHVRPRLAVISVGARNDYGHPTHQALSALRTARTPTLRTDQAGSVDVRLGPQGLLVRTSGPQPP